MAALRDDVMRRLEQLPADLKAEFPQVPLDLIERDVKVGADELVAQARFHDFVPVLVHRSVREHLRATAQAARAGSRPARTDASSRVSVTSPRDRR